MVEPLLNEDVICETDDETIYLSAMISPDVCMLPVNVIPAKVGDDVVFTCWSKSVRLSATVFPISVPPMDNVFAPTSILPKEPVDVDEPLTFPLAVTWVRFRVENSTESVLPKL